MKICLKTAAITCALLVVGAWPTGAQTPAPATMNATPGPSAKPRDEKKTLGPFRIAGQQFSVILLQSQAPGKPTNTLASLEILDHKGALIYQRAFADEKEGGDFVSATAELLPYTNGNALLIRYQAIHSAAQPVGYCQIFGFVKGKLAPYGGPESPSPLPQGFVMGAAARGGAMGMPMMQQGDPVELYVWTGNFYVIVPVLVDWSHTRVLPAQRCFEGGGPGLHERGCDMRVEAVRKPAKEEMTFVRMFQQPQEFEGGAKHVVVNKNSKIRYLAARSIVRWSMSGDLLQATFPDVWLKLLIDNDDEKEGWIHTEEEFEAVGLPSGSEPQ